VFEIFIRCLAIFPTAAPSDARLPRWWCLSFTQLRVTLMHTKLRDAPNWWSNYEWIKQSRRDASRVVW